MGMAPHQQSPQFCQKFSTENRVPVSKATWIEDCGRRPFTITFCAPVERPIIVAAYIWMNPVRKGLCKNFEEYSFFGVPSRGLGESLEALEIWMPPWKETKDARLKAGPYRDAVRRVF